MSSPAVLEPPMAGDQARVRVIMNHGHQDLVQAVAFNSYGDRCATGSVDGKIRVFNRHQDGTWRQCDNWTAHGGDILELQWLPPTIFPNLIASLGIEGRFKLWAEDPAAAPGKRFSQRNKENAKAAYEHRSRGGAPYRSFSLRHNDETRHTHLALLAADGVLDVLENEQPENLADFNPVDRLVVCNPRPARGEETSFRVRFDPNPDPCYSALRAGVQSDSLALVVAAMRTVRIYRSRDASSSAAGPSAREFYLAAEISGHGGLVRDVAWAAGNIRGYDIVATACQDGFVRVVRLDTPFSPDDGKSWSSSDLVKGGSTAGGTSSHDASGARSGTSRGSRNSLQQQQQQQSQHPVGLPNPPPARSVLGSELAISSANADRVMTGQPGEARHVVRELSRLETHRTPVWRVGFDDDGQILGSVGDDGKLMCYRQTPDGSWAKSSELAMVKMRMAVPQTEPGS